MYDTFTLRCTQNCFLRQEPRSDQAAVGLASTRTPRARIKVICLLRLSNDASIESLATKAAPSPGSQNCMPDPTSLRDRYLALTHVTWTQPQFANAMLQVTLSRLSSLFESISLPKNRQVLSISQVAKKGQQHCSTDSVNEPTLCEHLSSDLCGRRDSSSSFRLHPICRAQLSP